MMQRSTAIISSLSCLYLGKMLPRCNCKIYLQNKFSRFMSEDRNSIDYFNSKYKVFKDEDSQIIFDVEEEKEKKQNIPNVEQSSCNLEIRKSRPGVFDISELVELLEFHKAKDIFVIKIPPHLNYINFMVIVSAISRRHIIGLAESVRKEFKLKNNSINPPRIEGKDSNWVALDLDNIVLHIMSDSTRKLYDLESLWSVGVNYDIHANTLDDDVLRLLKEHSITLDDLQPASEKP